MNYNSLPSNVYYDANIINNDQSGEKEPPKLVFQDIRSIPILSYPQLYELSVVRFNIQTAGSLPLWIPSIKFDSNDKTITTYSFTLNFTYEGNPLGLTSDQVAVQYIPSDLSISPPNPVSNDELYNNPFYYVKSFNTIVEMFNNALSKAFDRLQHNANVQQKALPTEYPPFFEWDLDNSKFILNADVEGYNLKNPEHISIYCNSALYTLISGFQSDYYGVNASDGKNYKFKITKDIRNLNLFTISDNPPYSVIQLYQEYSSASLFSPVSSIVFTTNLLPVLPSNSTKPTIFNGTGNLVNSGNNNNLTTMITDFESQDNNGYGFSGSLAYIPTAEYRFITLNNGNDKINNIDIQVYWKDQYSTLHPIYLLPGCKCDIKILFRKIKNI